MVVKLKITLSLINEVLDKCEIMSGLLTLDQTYEPCKL